MKTEQLPQAEHPTQGGSYTRDALTGLLVLLHRTQPVAELEAPQPPDELALSQVPQE
jgi:hypothetical protein